MNSIALAFCRTIEDAGYQAAVYGNYDMLMHHLDGVSLSKQTGIWTAQYNTFAEFTGYFQYWQCSESLQLDGTESKYVDRDFWYVPVGETAYTFAQNADERTSLEDCKVTLKKDSYHYLGKPVKAKIKIKNGLRTLRKGRDYNVCYINNTSKGESYAVVTGVGKYKDTISLKFTIK